MNIWMHVYIIIKYISICLSIGTAWPLNTTGGILATIIISLPCLVSEHQRVLSQSEILQSPAAHDDMQAGEEYCPPENRESIITVFD